jgi:hypothetical protein
MRGLFPSAILLFSLCMFPACGANSDAIQASDPAQQSLDSSAVPSAETPYCVNACVCTSDMSRCCTGRGDLYWSCGGHGGVTCCRPSNGRSTCSANCQCCVSNGFSGKCINHRCVLQL